MVRETCKNTKLCFSPLICGTEQKDVDEKIKKLTHIWKTIVSSKT